MRLTSLRHRFASESAAMNMNTAPGISVRTVAAPCTSSLSTTSVSIANLSLTCCFGMPLYSPYTTACSMSSPSDIMASNSSVVTKK